MRLNLPITQTRKLDASNVERKCRVDYTTSYISILVTVQYSRNIAKQNSLTL